MKTMRLTSAEEKMILQNRQAIKHEKATEKFRREAFVLAVNFDTWLHENDSYPSFSDFVNNFGFQLGNTKLMYESVLRILDVVNSLELPKENAL